MGIEKGSNVIDVTTANSDTEVYKRTSGRVFKLRTLQLNNRSAASSRIRLWDGASADGRRKVDLTLAADESIIVTDVRGIDFKFGDVIAQATSVPVSIQVGGEEE